MQKQTHFLQCLRAIVINADVRKRCGAGDLTRGPTVEDLPPWPPSLEGRGRRTDAEHLGSTTSRGTDFSLFAAPKSRKTQAKACATRNIGPYSNDRRSGRDGRDNFGIEDLVRDFFQRSPGKIFRRGEVEYFIEMREGTRSE